FEPKDAEEVPERQRVPREGEPQGERIDTLQRADDVEGIPFEPKDAEEVPERQRVPREEGPQEGRMGAMRMADDMRNLTQEIFSAFEGRRASAAALRRDTAAHLKGFQQEMKGLRRDLGGKAADLRQFLSTATASRMQEFRVMHENIRVGQEARSRHLQEMLAGCRGMLSDFRRDHKGATHHWQQMARTLAKKRAGASR
ncbi:MAG: hypothetical protein WCI75_18180, partial [candidate division NC10 bacterium]